MKSTFQLHPVTLLPQDHGTLLKDGKLDVQWMDQPFIPPSLSEITSCKCKKGRCGNRRCKCVNVGLLCFDLCNCIDCENHDRETDDEDTSDGDSDIEKIEIPIVIEMNLMIQVFYQASLRKKDLTDLN